jgi:ABC-type uncharacterized transport system permease subunit
MRYCSFCVSDPCQPTGNAGDQRHAFGITLALYPRNIFQGVVRFLMLTLLPAAFVGAIPLDIVRRLNWTALLGLVGFAVGITLLSRFVFYAGLRRYESGSAINVNV